MPEEKGGVVNGQGETRVTLSKNNQKYRTNVKNYSSEATTAENCFVTEVVSDSYDTKVPLTIAKGITIGSSEKDLKNALEGTEFVMDESAGYFYYLVTPTESSVDDYSILVNKESLLVEKITLRHRPNYEDYVTA